MKYICNVFQLAAFINRISLPQWEISIPSLFNIIIMKIEWLEITLECNWVWSAYGLCHMSHWFYRIKSVSLNVRNFVQRSIFNGFTINEAFLGSSLLQSVWVDFESNRYDVWTSIAWCNSILMHFKRNFADNSSSELIPTQCCGRIITWLCEVGNKDEL